MINQAAYLLKERLKGQSGSQLLTLQRDFQ
jgi:hypothetical protein